MTAGITCDNYKIAKFKEEFIKRGYSIDKEVPFTKDTTILKVEYSTTTELDNISAIVRYVQSYFKTGTK